MITIKRIKSQYIQLCDLIHAKKITDALDILKQLISESGFSDFFIRQEYLESTYEQMLKYTLEGVHDPERDKIFRKLQMDIQELADVVKSSLLRKYSGWHTFTLQEELEKKQKLTGKGVIESLDDLAFRVELDEIINEKKNTPKASELRRRGLIMEIFKHLWLTDNYGEAENSLAKTLISCKDFTWYEQTLQISAILLSGMRFWDEEKVYRIIEFTESDDQQVSGRALVALVILLYMYDQRLHLYPGIVDRLTLLKDGLDMDTILEQVVLQFIRSEETVELGKKLHEDIIPEISKLKPKLEDKLKMEDIQDEEMLEKGNPDWESVFRESDELYKKVDKFMKLQMEGADVYMTTFAMLKNFPFFNELTNWIIPFYDENPDLAEIYEMESEDFNPEAFITGLRKMPFLCNSDKYSFILNVKHLPAEQKKMLSSAFQMEMEGLQEMLSDEELMDNKFVRRIVFVQYIQDLYRFFKLSPFKNEFEDVFSGSLNIENASFFDLLVDDKSITRNIAEYYFEKNRYEDAIEMFKKLHDTNPDDPELLEKLGFSFQQMENYRAAISYYDKLDLHGQGSIWLLKNLGLCYRKLDNFVKALEVYEKAASLAPEDTKIEAFIAFCNMKLNRFDIALQKYFKLEYEDPKKSSVLRPIAWCYFSLKEYEKSEKYYTKIFEIGPDYYDYVNYGHLLWATGNRKAAIENYILSTNYKSFPFPKLLSTIEEDSPVLEHCGVDKEEISLMMDYLRYKMR